jgi:hypothetical protein
MRRCYAREEIDIPDEWSGVLGKPPPRRSKTEYSFVHDAWLPHGGGVPTLDSFARLLDESSPSLWAIWKAMKVATGLLSELLWLCTDYCERTIPSGILCPLTRKESWCSLEVNGPITLSIFPETISMRVSIWDCILRNSILYATISYTGPNPVEISLIAYVRVPERSSGSYAWLMYVPNSEKYHLASITFTTRGVNCKILKSHQDLPDSFEQFYQRPRAAVSMTKFPDPDFIPGFAT